MYKYKFYDNNIKNKKIQHLNGATNNIILCNFVFFFLIQCKLLDFYIYLKYIYTTLQLIDDDEEDYKCMCMCNSI